MKCFLCEQADLVDSKLILGAIGHNKSSPMWCSAVCPGVVQTWSEPACRWADLLGLVVLRGAMLRYMICNCSGDSTKLPVSS